MGPSAARRHPWCRSADRLEEPVRFFPVAFAIAALLAHAVAGVAQARTFAACPMPVAPPLGGSESMPRTAVDSTRPPVPIPVAPSGADSGGAVRLRQPLAGR
jgi:hypothetical protein